jgi:hypothetical protein
LKWILDAKINYVKAIVKLISNQVAIVEGRETALRPPRFVDEIYSELSLS